MVFDPFHIAKHMNDAVNDVRKWEHRLLAVDGKSPLTGSRFLWLFGRENLPDLLSAPAVGLEHEFR